MSTGRDRPQDRLPLARLSAAGLPPLRLPEAERTDRYLSLIERKRIATLGERGHGVREIARRPGVKSEPTLTHGPA